MGIKRRDSSSPTHPGDSDHARDSDHIRDWARAYVKKGYGSFQWVLITSISVRLSLALLAWYAVALGIRKFQAAGSGQGTLRIMMALVAAVLLFEMLSFMMTVFRVRRVIRGIEFEDEYGKPE